MKDQRRLNKQLHAVRSQMMQGSSETHIRRWDQGPYEVRFEGGKGFSAQSDGCLELTTRLFVEDAAAPALSSAVPCSQRMLGRSVFALADSRRLFLADLLEPCALGVRAGALVVHHVLDGDGARR